jgi:AcrR family transcriptional regulator
MLHPDELYSRVLELFKKYGIKSITMDDVSSELGISKKTLYTLVQEKKELVEKVANFEFKNVKSCFDRVFEKEGLNAIEQLFEVNYFMRNHLKYQSIAFDYDLRKYYPDLYRALSEKRQQEMYDSVLNNMKKGKTEGIYRQDLDEELIAKLYVTRIIHAHESAVISIEDFTAPKAFRQYFVYHIRGIANAKGIKILEKNLDKLESPENEKSKNE